MKTPLHIHRIHPLLLIELYHHFPILSLSDGFNWYLVSECLDEIDSETAGFELHIQKSSTSEIKTVYSWKAFFENIENLNLFELLNWIWKLIERCGKMVLYVP